MATSRTTVIVGANLAGGRAAAGLRTHGYDGRIVLVGAEVSPPYERPPLSKELLWGVKALPQFCLHPEAFYSEKRIDLRVSTRVERLDLSRRRVVLERGEEIEADSILLATGGRPRKLVVEGIDLDGVLYLRNHDDAVALRSRLQPGSRVVVVGMGVIGAEVAASAIRLGCAVTAIEVAAVPMSRIFGTELGGWLRRKHERSGVRVLVGAGVARIFGRDGQVVGVEASTGERIAADVVVVGVGIELSSELAVEAGLQVVPQGIVVDRHCRTSVADVYAAGDVTAQCCFFSGRPVRVETFQNAQDQGLAAAASIAGKPAEHCRPSWFWTDQFDLNIQAVGRVEDGLTTVVRGDPDSERFSVLFLNAGVVEGMVAVNAAQEMAVGRRLVERRVAVDAASLADGALPLKTFLTARPARTPA